MNAWYMLLIYVCAILFSLGLCAGSLAAMIYGVVKQKRLGGRLAFLIAAGVITAAVLLFTNSHATYYRFSDWAISGSTVTAVVEKYGEPDIGSYTEGKSGRLGYFIYRDDGPIMPDHLDHYYYVEYNEQGRVTSVYDGVQPGG